MSGTTLSARETARIEAVRRYDILDTPPDGAFDRITALVARRLEVPIAIISIVDEDRIWFKSHYGLTITQIDRDPGLCASAILGDAPYILEDARKDPRSLANPLVVGQFGLQFYAAVPLTTIDGHNLGTLCAIDREPRKIEDVEVEDLKDLAAVVVDQLELRLASLQAIGRAHLLAREIDHRVMNSLQFVSSLLTMQSRLPGIGNSAAHLEQAASRVAAVAQVHRNFYAAEATDVSCIAFLRRLCEDLSVAIDRKIDVGGDEGLVPSSAIQSIGLITNELVTNAVKHGDGKIDVTLRVRDEMISLTVTDNGEGLVNGFDPHSASTGLGMRVITTLVAKLQGSLIAGRNKDGAGASFTVQFPRVLGQIASRG